MRGNGSPTSWRFRLNKLSHGQETGERDREQQDGQEWEQVKQESAGNS